jgi:6-phosphofructokinase 2
MGPEGVLCVTQDKSLRIPAIAVEAKSTVGAGDSFLAAMVLSLSRSESLEQSLIHGLAAGAAAILTPGTKLCRRADVETLLRAANALPVEIKSGND